MHKHISVSIVDQQLTRILEENGPVYENYLNLLPRTQVELLKAIACEEGVRTPMASGFVGKYGLGSTSSVQTALKALLDKEMIYEDGAKYFLYDVFFSRWLKRRFHLFA